MRQDVVVPKKELFGKETTRPASLCVGVRLGYMRMEFGKKKRLLGGSVVVWVSCRR